MTLQMKKMCVCGGGGEDKWRGLTDGVGRGKDGSCDDDELVGVGKMGKRGWIGERGREGGRRSR